MDAHIRAESSGQGSIFKTLLSKVGQWWSGNVPPTDMDSRRGVCVFVCVFIYIHICMWCSGGVSPTDLDSRKDVCVCVCVYIHTYMHVVLWECVSERHGFKKSCVCVFCVCLCVCVFVCLCLCLCFLHT